MKQLNRYVAKHIVAATLLVIAMLVGLFSVSLFAEEMSDAPDHYSLINIFIYVIFSVPGMVATNATFALLIGSLLGLGVLASQSELTVMRASGVSVLNIVLMVIKPALVLIVLIGLVREFVVPAADRYANHFRAEKIEEDPLYNLIRSTHGLWLRQENQFVHFNYVNAQGDVFGFARFAFSDDGEMKFAQYAPRAVHKGDGTEPGWQLENARTTTFDNNETKIDVQENFWKSELNPNLVAVVALDPEEMSMRELHYYINYLGDQNQDARTFELTFWGKVLQPLAMIGLVLVAISTIFGSLRATTMGYRLFFGIMLGMAFRFSQSILGPASMVYGFSPWMAIALPIVVCWGLGFFFLARVK
ncbi:MAG: LPS export ABC transporter permease LptG [Pseudomonadales bacterium]